MLDDVAGDMCQALPRCSLLLPGPSRYHQLGSHPTRLNSRPESSMAPYDVANNTGIAHNPIPKAIYFRRYARLQASCISLIWAILGYLWASLGDGCFLKTLYELYTDM
jgi:hypothetical protein